LQLRGLHPTIIPVDRAGVPTYDELVLVANAQRLAKDATYRDTVARFVHAFGRARAARVPPRRAIAILKKVTASPEKFLAAATPATLKPTSTCVDVAQWQRRRVDARAGALKGAPCDPRRDGELLPVTHRYAGHSSAFRDSWRLSIV
jgi:hypothetical protein